jgi:tRNA threonylcarbamoyladenosine biosynthesis protein TsaB
MRILAIETSTDLASCALYCDGQLSETTCPRTSGDQGQHSATLLPAIHAMLSEQHLAISDLDAIAFGAVAQGLAVPYDTPVVPVSGLAAMAWATYGQSEQNSQPLSITALLDARMGEIYVGSFEASPSGIRLTDEIQLTTQAVLIGSGKAAPVVCGNCFSEYPELVNHYATQNTQVFPDQVPSAKAIAELAVFELNKGNVLDAALAAPLYVRNKVAKTVAERLAEGGRA